MLPVTLPCGSCASTWGMNSELHFRERYGLQCLRGVLGMLATSEDFAKVCQCIAAMFRSMFFVICCRLVTITCRLLGDWETNSVWLICLVFEIMLCRYLSMAFDICRIIRVMVQRRPFGNVLFRSLWHYYAFLWRRALAYEKQHIESWRSCRILFRNACASCTLGGSNGSQRRCPLCGT